MHLEPQGQLQSQMPNFKCLVHHALAGHQAVCEQACRMDDQVVRGLRILSLYLNGLAMHAAVDALFEPGFADVEKIAEEDAWQVLNARKAVAADGLCERGDQWLDRLERGTLGMVQRHEDGMCVHFYLFTLGGSEPCACVHGAHHISKA